MDIEDVLRKIGDKYVSELRRTLKEERHFATGDLHNSIKAEVRNKTLRVYAKKHLLSLSGGQPTPKKLKPSPDMIERVMRWMKAKGIQPSTYNKKTKKVGLIRNKKGQFRSRKNMRRSAAIGMSTYILRKMASGGYKGSNIIGRSYEKLRPVIGNDIMDYFENEIGKEFKKIRFTK